MVMIEIYCVISLCNLDVIQPLNYKSAKIKKIKEIISENINKCRLTWNKTSCILRFKIDGVGNPINELERV